jgi:hypothetical protein
MARGKRNINSKSNGATLGFEATLWAAVDKLRNNTNAAENKQAILGLIFVTNKELGQGWYFDFNIKAIINRVIIWQIM